MSIVEKAIAKLQSAGAAAEAPRRAPQVRPTPQTLPNVTRPPAEMLDMRITVSASIAVDMQALQAAGMLPPDHGALAVRNQFRRLKWSLLDEIQAVRTKSLPQAGAFMITSALPGEGKTFTTLNLAMSLAREENYRVILVDADVAKGHISELFGLQNRPGLMELLADSNLAIADALVETSIERLYVLPAGKFQHNVAELMSGARMTQVLTELTGNDLSRIVVFDSSPVLATNAAQVLARALSQVLLVVRAENTPQAAVLEAIELLDRNKVAAVLNQSHMTMANDNYNQLYGNYGNEER